MAGLSDLVILQRSVNQLHFDRFEERGSKNLEVELSVGDFAIFAMIFECGKKMATSLIRAVWIRLVFLSLFFVVSNGKYCNVEISNDIVVLPSTELFLILRVSKRRSSHLVICHGRSLIRLLEHPINLLRLLTCPSLVVSAYMCVCLGVISLLLLLSGDIEVNPGPCYKYPCSRCDKPVKSNQDGIQCDGCDLWFHRQCEYLSKSAYLSLSNSNEAWLCSVCALPNFSDSFFSSYCDSSSDSSGLSNTVISDVFVICESWLDASVSQNEISIPNYSILRNDRNRHGGGVAVFFKSSMKATLIHSENRFQLESLWLSLSGGSIPPSTVLCVFYRPPSASRASIDELFSQCQVMLACFRHVIICGDLNINLLFDNTLSTDFLNTLSILNLRQVISDPTRVTCTSKSLIDVCIVDSESPVVSSGTLGFGFSDHLICYSVFNWKSVPAPTKTSSLSRSYKSFSPSQFQSNLDVVPWSLLEIFDDPDDKLNAYDLLLKDVVDKCAPLVKKKQRKNASPWITEDLRKKMLYRNRLYRKFLKSRLQSDLVTYRNFRNHVTGLQRKAKRHYLSNLVNNNATSSTIWSALKILMNNGNPSNTNSSTMPSASDLNNHFIQVCNNVLSAGTPLSDTQIQPAPSPLAIDLDIPHLSPHECASLIQHLKPKRSTGCDSVSPVILKAAPEQLSLPLSSIINSAISQQQFPSSWKSAIVHPLHKAGSTDICSNYRPISILPAASKVMEMYIADMLKAHLETNNLLYPLQSGFRQGHSTQSLLLKFTDSWYKSLDNGNFVGVVFLDISKAFDTVNHELLLHKLRTRFLLITIPVSAPSIIP